MLLAIIQEIIAGIAVSAVTVHQSTPLSGAVTARRGDAGLELRGQSVPKGFTQHIESAAESILEDESLTDELDDAAAKVLLAWGVACAETIAQGTAGLDEDEVEKIMAPRLRTTRRLMRQVNQWNAKRGKMNLEENAETLDEVIEKAVTIYGKGYVPPDDEQRAAFLDSYLAAEPAQMIENLRTLVES